LSFVDGAKPEGQRFLGVCIVDVTDEDAADAQAILDDRFPQHAEGAAWIAAATRKAWLMGCNPGGEVAAIDITEAPPPKGVELPVHRLLQRPELVRLGLMDANQDTPPE
jgi:hypothetical protein